MECVTLVRELVLQVSRGDLPGVPSPHVVRIGFSGELFVEGPVAAGGRTVSRAAQLLDTLLPGLGATPEHRVPGGLRLAIARGLGMLDAPPYPSLESFADALVRFASPDPTALLSDLAARWAAAEPVSSDASAAPVPDEASAVELVAAGAALDGQPQEREPEFAWAGQSLDGASTTSLVRSETELLTVSDIRRARRATGLPLSEVSNRSRIPVPMLRQLEWGYLRHWPVGVQGRTQLVRYARAAGLDEQIVVDTLWPQLETAAHQRESLTTPAAGALEVANFSIDEFPLRRSRTDVSPVTRSKRKRTRILAALAIPALLALGLLPGLLERQQWPSSWPSQRIAGVEVEPEQLQVPAIEQAAVVDNDTTAQRNAAAPELPAQTTAAPELPAQTTAEDRSAPAPLRDDATPARDSRELVQSSDAAPARGLADDVVAYSPSFASIGSAMFFHTEGERGSALMRADTDDDGAVLQITKVVDDNARNFHARPSPDGRLIAFDSDREGERGVYIARADGTDVRRVSGTGFAAVPSWSPDGTMLAFVRAEPNRPKVWNVWLMALDTGQMRPLTSHRFGQPWGGSWFPDGRRMAYSHEERLIVLDIVTGKERVYPSPRKGRLVRTPAVSPDGSLVIFQVRGDGAWLLDVDDGSMRKVLADPSAEEYTWSPDGRRVAYHSRQSGQWGVWLMAAR